MDRRCPGRIGLDMIGVSTIGVTMGTSALLLLSLVPPVLGGSFPAESRYGEFGPVSVRLGTTEPTNLYLESEFPETYREPSVVVTLSSAAAAGEEVSLSARGEILDYSGSARAVRPESSQVTLPPGERKKLTFATDPGRGVFTFRLTVTGEGALAGLPRLHLVRSFAVLPAPADGLDPDSFFRIENAPVWRPYTAEWCRRLGVKAVRVFVDPETNQELFDGWVGAARSRGLSLESVCRSESLASDSYGSVQPRSDGTSFHEYLHEVRWGQCGFRLASGECRPEFLYQAARRILEGYALEGGVDQLAYLLAHAESGATAKLTELGVVLADGGDSYPEPSPHFLRLLDWGAGIARTYERRVALSGFRPSGVTMTDGAALLAAYTLCSLAGYHAVSSQGPGGILEDSGRPRVGLAQIHGTLAYFLRGRVPVADVWPRQTLLCGCIYADPRFRPADAERRDILAVRDHAAGQRDSDDTLKVAIMFSFAEPIGSERESNGAAPELFIKQSGDLAAYDLTGRPTGLRTSSGLSIPFGREPVYVTTHQLDAAAFAETLRRAEIRGLSLFTVSAQPFTEPGLAFPKFRVLVDNSDTREVGGVLEVEGEWGDGSPQSSARFTVSPGEVQVLELPLKRSIRKPDGVYPFRITATTRLGVFEQHVSVPSTIIWPVSAHVDGKLAEWEKVAGLDLAAGSRRLSKDGAREGDDHRGASAGPVVWAGYDSSNLYVAVRIEGAESSAGWDGSLTPEALGELLGGTSVQIAVGFGERSADHLHPAEDLWYVKGMLRDTDYLFCLAPTKAGASKLVCLHRPGMVWGESLLCGAEELPGGSAVVRGEGRDTIGEAAIPLAFLKGFDRDITELRLGFVIKAGGTTYQTAERCWVPAHFASGGSFLPVTDATLRPNQVRWGIAR